jgi:hypothetical protein
VTYLDVQNVSTLNITAPILPYGKHFWQAQPVDAAGNIGEWSAPRSFSITIQRTPVDGATTNDTTPTFTRVSLSGATLYRIQISTQDTFDTGFTETYDRTPAQGTSFTLGSGDALGYGVYYWRIGVENTGDGEIDLWMPAWTLYVTNLARPVAPLLALPDDDTVTVLLPLTLSWNGVTNGNQYEVQIANNTLFNVPLVDQVLGPAVTSYDANSLSDGTYYWRVRGLNTQGAPGAWSGWRSFTVDLL